MRNSFSQSRAIKTTRAQKSVRQKAREIKARAENIVKGLKDPNPTLPLAHEVARFVLQKVPLSVSRAMDVEFTKRKFRKSFSKTAEESIRKNSDTGFMPCIERCNLAISLLRRAKIKAWLARELFFEPPSTKIKVHDYVEFFANGKVHTMALGFGVMEQMDTYRINESPVRESGFSRIFRGIESSQIGGANNYQKFQKFAKEAFTNKQAVKNNARMKLLVESGVIPPEAYAQIKRGYL